MRAAEEDMLEASRRHKKREAVFNRFPVTVKYEVGLPAEWH